jgi:hypothetical protein
MSIEIEEPAFKQLKSKEVHDYLIRRQGGDAGLLNFAFGLNNEENEKSSSEFYKKGAALLDPLCLYKLSLILRDVDQEISDLCFIISASLMPRTFVDFNILEEARKMNFEPVLKKFDFLVKKLEEILQVVRITQLLWIEDFVRFFLQPDKEKYNILLKSLEYGIKHPFDSKCATICLNTLLVLHLSDREQVGDFQTSLLLSMIKIGWNYMENICENMLEELKLIEVSKREKPFLHRFCLFFIEVGLAVRYIGPGKQRGGKINGSRSQKAPLQDKTNCLFFEISQKLLEMKDHISDDINKTFIFRFQSECFEKGYNVKRHISLYLLS